MLLPVQKPSKCSELFEGSLLPERWNVVTRRHLDNSSYRIQKSRTNAAYKPSHTDKLLELNTKDIIVSVYQNIQAHAQEFFQ